MKITFTSFLFVLIAAIAFSQSRPVSTHTAETNYYTQAKNYYLLTLLEHDASVSATLKNDAVLASLTKKKLQQLSASATECKTVACFVDAIKFSIDDIKTVNERLSILYKNNPALARLVKTKLIPSGAYSLYNNLPPAEVLVKAWEQDASAINYTLDVYAGGKKPNYPTIDSISYNVASKGYANLIYDADVTLYGDVKNTRLFFEPALKGALLFLQMNERETAGNYEPMAQTVNRSSLEYIKTLNWKKYPYTNILVPGAGPGDLTTRLSGEGMLRCRMAAQQFNKGIAPLIIVSGGKAHPYKTKYCEAVEMKAYLINVLNIPAKAIIVEPHSRHTTTNLRNCARLIYEYHIPTYKQGVIVTDKSQTDFIMTMDKRCEKELGYVPYKLANRISDTEVEYLPMQQARQIDPDEPLDPR